jgi:hypothetical protein
MAYSSKYVDLTEIPVQIPDDYSDTEKGDALEFAESSIELELTEGQAIEQDTLGGPAGFAIRSAIKQKATCELAKGAEHPDDTALTDLSDTGSDKADYAAEAFCDRYQELVDKIQDSGVLGDDASGTTSPYVYSTSDPTPDDRYWEFPVDEDDYDKYD